ncbi:ADP-ribosyl cyclase isoform X1 [Strongylocentrotus purpuratus]|uniref:ADP-ribosyl cyclase/cyclic ADP-ribose hydrolase n=1 Tax=Strongylocentrotus purpuratus TaxID=7668 RepID=A0A7M7N0W6_STRPU|nr:ADP-ribosyl cyclase isoform X1 [Strongylocentrotus purpuratus]XP_030829527.1 ADP-ribosyl cyclase isoform X1 [Strongylocentrotus purpuratus]|eukprot:XP_011663014.1 PREDICTED: ADP-ribosyl cyclase isoform X1 [Strongylocentrotus purpuratus]
MGIYTIFIYLSPMLAMTVAYINTGPGTTSNITDILTGRCEEYRKCLLGEPCLPFYRNVKCRAAVESFFKGIRNMDPCATPDNAYDEFLNMVPPTTVRGTTMFWSGVMGNNIPQDVAQVTPEFSVLEETFPGYMAGNLSWCGATDGDGTGLGLNFTVCPTWTSETCPNNTKAAFWARASKMLATQAVGDVYVVLNAQRAGGAFNNGSIFATIEAPNLNQDVVTNVAIYLIPDFTLPIPNEMYRETCTNGSVLYLQNFLMNMNFNVTCEENPKEIMWLQCARFANSPYCGPYAKGTPVVAASIVVILLQAIFAMSLSGWNTISTTL